MIFRQRPTLPHGNRAVPSALKGLTSVFGMGTGGTPSIKPPETFGSASPVMARAEPAHAQESCDGRSGSTLASAAKPRGQRFEKKNDQASRAISIGQLNALPRLHLRPIDVVVFDGPSGGLRPGRPRLEVRFPLRCFQRLSNPHTATQRCHWRDNWYTGGASNPVLSY